MKQCDSGLSSVLFLVMLLNYKSLAVVTRRNLKWGIAEPRQRIEKVQVDQLSASWWVVGARCLEDFSRLVLCSPFCCQCQVCDSGASTALFSASPGRKRWGWGTGRVNECAIQFGALKPGVSELVPGPGSVTPTSHRAPGGFSALVCEMNFVKSTSEGLKPQTHGP